MALSFHPAQGTIVICDFNGLIPPEMEKRRPAIVVCPRFRERPRLCTVVPCSTTAPRQAQPYHYQLRVDPPLPAPYASPMHWIKGDMIYTVSLDRLFMPFMGKDANGRRIYDERRVSDEDLKAIQACMLAGLGIVLDA